MDGNSQTAAASPKRHFHMLRTIDHPERTAEILALLNDCYAESPMFLHWFKEDLRRGLDWNNARRIAASGRYSEFWLSADGRVEGHIVLRPPMLPEEEPTEAEQEHLQAKEDTDLQALFGLECWQRRKFAMRVFRTQNAIALQKLPAVDQKWSLTMLAVRADCQGRGIGAAVIRQLLEERVEPLAASGKSVQVYLMSQMERNLPLYLRLGFKFVDQTRLEGKSEWGDVDLPNCVMSRSFPADTGLEDHSML